MEVTMKPLLIRFALCFIAAVVLVWTPNNFQVYRPIFTLFLNPLVRSALLVFRGGASFFRRTNRDIVISLHGVHGSSSAPWPSFL